jgi:hypothetical protein
MLDGTALLFHMSSLPIRRHIFIRGRGVATSPHYPIHAQICLGLPSHALRHGEKSSILKAAIAHNKLLIDTAWHSAGMCNKIRIGVDRTLDY